MNTLPVTSQFLSLLKENITGFAHLSDVNFIVIFGSFATGDTHHNSDIDICVSFEGYNKNTAPERYSLVSNLLAHFEKSISTDKIDLSVWERLNPNLRYNVLKNHKLLYQKSESFFHVVIAKTLQIYWEQKEWYDRMVNNVFSGGNRE